jgi:hypothetical protein
MPSQWCHQVSYTLTVSCKAHEGDGIPVKITCRERTLADHVGGSDETIRKALNYHWDIGLCIIDILGYYLIRLMFFFHVVT